MMTRASKRQAAGAMVTCSDSVTVTVFAAVVLLCFCVFVITKQQCYDDNVPGSGVVTRVIKTPVGAVVVLALGN